MKPLIVPELIGGAAEMKAMQSVIAPEMISGAMEMVVYFVTALAALMSLVLTARA